MKIDLDHDDGGLSPFIGAPVIAALIAATVYSLVVGGAGYVIGPICLVAAAIGCWSVFKALRSGSWLR